MCQRELILVIKMRLGARMDGSVGKVLTSQAQGPEFNPHNQGLKSQVWWHVFIIPELGQADRKIHRLRDKPAILTKSVRPCLKRRWTEVLKMTPNVDLSDFRTCTYLLHRHTFQKNNNKITCLTEGWREDSVDTKTTAQEYESPEQESKRPEKAGCSGTYL